MTTETDPVPSQLTPEDPRFSFAQVTDIVGKLIESIEDRNPDVLAMSTPCSEFTVANLLDHVVMVMRRVAVIGNGGHFSLTQHETLGANWHREYRLAAHDVMEAWTEAAKLGQMFEVPWGEVPGVPLLFSYTGELAVHGWDLAIAVGERLVIADELLAGALVAAKHIPAEGRDLPELPYDPVVDPGPEAPVLDQLAGWMGRLVVPA